jgi:predicted GNAT superfamily acetyltransferase
VTIMEDEVDSGIVLEWEAADRHLVIRDVTTDAEFRQVEDIQREAWGFRDLDVVPWAHIIAAKWAGGIILGAFDGERMAGFVYGFPAFESGRQSLHSHMLAVRPESRNLKAGIKLKLAQRLKAIAMGVQEITWTFDPLQSLNAHLNFTKLGVVSNRYLVNFYGEETSSPLHRGVGTDRLWVRWLLGDERVKSRAESAEAQRGPQDASPPGVDLDPGLLEEPGPLLLGTAGDKWEKLPHADPDADSAEYSGYLIEIPADIALLKDQNIEWARNWRMKVQGWFLSSFERGFQASDFVTVTSTIGPRRLYLLNKIK